MREIWSPAWFATALCVIALVAGSFGRWEAAAPAFFSFLPVVFLMLARSNQSLARRVEELERLQQDGER